MKKMRKILSIVLVITLSLLLMPEVSAEVEKNTNSETIYGIDYYRITQETGGTEKHPVELKLGDVTFTGEMFGEFGLSMEELNQIIRDTLKEKNLTIEQVVKVDQIAKHIVSITGAYFGKQTLEGVLSAATIPGMPVSIGDIYSYFTKDEVIPAVTSNTVKAYEMAAEQSMKATMKAGRAVGKVTKLGVKAIPVLGQVVSTGVTLKDWKEGNQKFDEYLKEVEANFAIMNDFYIACSQKAAALAESNDSKNVWKIKFPQTTQKYKCTIWGIPDNVMRVTLKGELTNSSGGKAGDYTGTISLEFDKEDLTPLETHLEDTSGFAPMKSVLYSVGGYRKIKDEPETVSILTRSMEGKVTLHVSETTGTAHPKFVGSLSSEKDETSFMLNRNMEWRDDSAAALGAVGITEAKINSFDLTKMTVISSSRVERNGTEQVREDNVTDFSQDPGTVFSPVDVDPVFTIDFSK